MREREDSMHSVSGTLFVANLRGGDISVIDVGTEHTLRRIQVGGLLDDIIVVPDDDSMYLTRKDLGDVLCVSLESGEIDWATPVGGKPHHFVISPEGDSLYVPVFDRNQLHCLDCADGTIRGTVDVGFGPHGTRITNDGERVYTGTLFSDHIAVVDTAGLEVVQTIEFEDGVRPFYVTDDEKTLYVQISGLHGFHVVDGESGAITQTVRLPPLPDGTEPAIYNTVDHGLEVTPDEKSLIACATTGQYAAIYRLPDLTLLGTVETGREPCWVITDFDSTTAFVASRESNSVSVISLTGPPKEEARFEVGEYPQRMFFLPASA